MRSLAVALDLQRPPGPAVWVDWKNAVQGSYATGQQVCDARRALIDWYQPLTFRLDPGADWKGFCESERRPGWIDVLGAPFKGSQCPSGYQMRDNIDGEMASIGPVSYGPNQYCALKSWPDCPANSQLAGGTCQCNEGYREDAASASCIAPPAPEPAISGNACRAPAGTATPHPILPATAEKYRSELDWSDAGAAPR